MQPTLRGGLCFTCMGEPNITCGIHCTCGDIGNSEFLEAEAMFIATGVSGKSVMRISLVAWMRCIKPLCACHGVTIGALNFEETAYFCRLPKIYTGTMLQMYNTML